ncbi:MAG: hypothetical protein NZ528_04240 [Caldilineales bacterium]|nr:hypothetical protein [Caldilineales bacterium]MDW8317734.1 hypothetical protein [Anaerolineae bacterium]
MASLEEWERCLRPKIDEVNLIGELNLEPSQAKAIGRLLAEYIRRHGARPSVIEQAARDYPATFAAFLVFQGAQTYHTASRGDFWPGLCDELGLPYDPNITLRLGQAFESVCKSFRLPHNFSGHRYVGAILGHGGIPARSLPDFFEHMLQPSVNKPELAALSTPELILEWLTSSAQYHVDKPILRFLEYGGKVAEDFVERCRQMAWAWMEEKDVPAADELGLPAALVDAYYEWVTQLGLDQPVPLSGPRLKKPAIVLDPWGLGVCVVLPEQQLPAVQSLAESWWEIETDGTIDRIPVDARRVDMDLKTRLACGLLRKPAPEYKVRFYRRVGQAASELVREWAYRGVGATQSFLAFDPQTGGLIPQPRHLPARLLWILCPPDGMVQSDPPVPSLIREKLPSLPWDWHAWRGYALDLRGVSTLTIRSSLGQTLISVVEAQAEPTVELVNAKQLDLLEDPVPVFVGTPPKLRIRAAEGGASEVRLARWRLELSHEWEADPKRDIRTRLSELSGLVMQQDGYIELPLSHPQLLGAEPVGQYRLRLRGPFGSCAELRFRIVPHLHVIGHEDVYLPAPDNSSPMAQLLLETDAHSRVEFMENHPEAQLQELACDSRSRCYEVRVPPDCADAPLRLVHQVRDGHSAYIPLRIPIRRLRWSVILQADSIAQPVWRSSPSTIYLAELDQSLSPYLFLELPVVAGSDLSVELRFLGVDDEVITELSSPRPSRPARLRRFDLRSVRDALRMSSSPAIRVDLHINGLPVRDPLTLTILTIRRSIAVEWADVVLLKSDGKQSVEVAWEPEISLRWRQVRLWSLTRPWTEPITVPIPDSARGKHTFPLEADALPPGRYLIEFSVSDPWLPETAPTRPQSDAPNVKSVVIGSLEERLAELEAARRQGKEVFSCACESAFLWKELGRVDRAEESLEHCWQSRRLASLSQLLTLAQQFRDLPTGRAFGLRLYTGEQLREVITTARHKGLSHSVLGAYLNGLPPLRRLTPDALEALLDAPDERLRTAAASHLIEEGYARAVQAVLEWEASGRLSRRDLDDLLSRNLSLAVNYLANNLPPEELLRLLDTSDRADVRLALAAEMTKRGRVEGVLAIAHLYANRAISADQALAAIQPSVHFAVRCLHEHKPGRGTRRLLDAILDAYPKALPVVEPGVWMKCNLGWARIDSIQSAHGEIIPWFSTHEVPKGARFSVTFHPDTEAICAAIDTQHRQVFFQGLSTVYLCRKCNQYIASRYERITGEHDRRAHGGVQPRFATLCVPVPLVGGLEFRHKPPA